jgi:hypothetical protein
MGKSDDREYRLDEISLGNAEIIIIDKHMMLRVCYLNKKPSCVHNGRKSLHRSFRLRMLLETKTKVAGLRFTTICKLNKAKILAIERNIDYSDITKNLNQAFAVMQEPLTPTKFKPISLAINNKLSKK